MRRAVTLAVTIGLTLTGLGGSAAAPPAPAPPGGPAGHRGPGLMLTGAALPARWLGSVPAKTVRYGGYLLSVPASWPVYRLDRDPAQCVRYDRHAVYLGRPGADQLCPAHLVGRVDTISVQASAVRALPGPGVGWREAPAMGLRNGLRQAGGLVLQDSQDHQVRATAARPGLTITATYGSSPALVGQIIRTARTAGGAAAQPSGSQPSGSRRPARPGPVPGGPARPGAVSGGPAQGDAAAGGAVRGGQAASAGAVLAGAAPAGAVPAEAVPAGAVPMGAPRAHRQAATGTGTGNGQHPGWAPAGELRLLGGWHAGAAGGSRTRAGRMRQWGTVRRGFDTCATPSLATMRKWHRAFSAIAVYIGGPEAACGWGNLSAAWVRATTRMGWALIPTYVGRQAHCTGFQMRIRLGHAYAEGRAAARQAVALAAGLGMRRRTPIYDDMEAYHHQWGRCRRSVLSFLNGWTHQLHAWGRRAGVYSSAGSAVADLGHAHTVYGHWLAKPDSIWFGLWDGERNLWGGPYVRPFWWPAGHRIKQWRGNHRRRIGGATLNIDSDLVAGAVYRLIAAAERWLTEMTWFARAGLAGPGGGPVPA